MSLLASVEHETAANPTNAVIWLHGLGADGHDFAPIVPQLVGPDWPAMRFVFPHAPVRPVTVNGGTPMRAWYDIKGASIADKQDADGIRASTAQVEALIAREGERGIPPARVWLAGFSQGGAMALAAGLRYRDALAGIVVLSAYLPLADTLAAERSTANQATPIFMAHGSADPVVPLALGRMSLDALQQLGYAVDWHTYPMGHQASAQEVHDLRAWMSPRLG